jgi:hypothetical protein
MVKYCPQFLYMMMGGTWWYSSQKCDAPNKCSTFNVSDTRAHSCNLPCKTCPGPGESPYDCSDPIYSTGYVSAPEWPASDVVYPEHNGWAMFGNPDWVLPKDHEANLVFGGIHPARVYTFDHRVRYNPNRDIIVHCGKYIVRLVEIELTEDIVIPYPFGICGSPITVQAGVIRVGAQVYPIGEPIPGGGMAAYDPPADDKPATAIHWGATKKAFLVTHEGSAYHVYSRGDLSAPIEE